MSSLTIVPPTSAPVPRAAPGPVVDAPASANVKDVPRHAVVVELSEQVRESSHARKQEADQRRPRPDASPDLTDHERRELRRLRRADRDVRFQEAAQLATAGEHARGATRFRTVIGPDGRRYATEAEVTFDVSPIDDSPEATLAKMEQIASAAMTPPFSARDLMIAAEARRHAETARREILQGGAETEPRPHGSLDLLA